MAHDQASHVTEEELRRVCLQVSSRGESITHILSEFLHHERQHENFAHEQAEADRAAAHRADGEDQDGLEDWWIASGVAPAPGRHRAVS